MMEILVTGFVVIGAVMCGFVAGLGVMFLKYRKVKKMTKLLKHQKQRVQVLAKAEIRNAGEIQRQLKNIVMDEGDQNDNPKPVE